MEHAQTCQEREASVCVLPVERSSLESVCKASMISEKVPWEDRRLHETDRWRAETASWPGATEPGGTYRPREAEVHPDGVAERTLRDGVRDLEGVGAEHRRHGAAVGARRLRGGVGLVVLQADPKEGFTLALLLEGRGQAPPAAVLVALHPLLVEELLQLQLENPRTKPLRRRSKLGAARRAATRRVRSLFGSYLAQQQGHDGESRQDGAAHVQ